MINILEAKDMMNIYDYMFPNLFSKILSVYDILSGQIRSAFSN